MFAGRWQASFEPARKIGESVVSQAIPVASSAPLSISLLSNISYQPTWMVAFLDVLGWRELVKQSLEDPTLCSKMAFSVGLPALARSYPITEERVQAGENPLLIQFSDSIVIASNVANYLLTGDPFPVESLFALLDNICKSFLLNGLFVRGGISYGELFCSHDFNIVFGPALTEAYDVENKKSIYPRVVIHAKAKQLLATLPTNFHRRLIETADDGELYFNLLQIEPFWARENSVKEQQNFLNSLRPHLSRNLQESSHNWHVMQKYIWFAQYFNKSAQKCGVQEVEIGERPVCPLCDCPEQSCIM